MIPPRRRTVPWAGSFSLLFAALSLDARAAQTFGERPDEIRAIIARFEQRGLDLGQVRSELDSYFDDRDDAIERGIVFLGLSGSGDAGARWSSHYAGFASTAAVRMLDLRDHLPKLDSEDGKAVVGALEAEIARFAMQENRFFGSLAKVPLAAARDRLLAYREQFDEAQSSLAAQWNRQSYDDDSIDDQARRFRKEILALYKEAVESIASSVAAIEDHIRDGVEIVAKIDEADPTPSLRSFASAAANQFLQRMQQHNDRYERLISQLHATYQREGVVLILFKNTRKEVESFLASANLELASEFVEQARADALALVSRLATEGQREDAEELVELVVDQLEDRLEEFENLYEEFVDEWSEIFIGPIGDRTAEKLTEWAERQSWRSGLKSVKGKSMFGRVWSTLTFRNVDYIDHQRLPGPWRN